MGGGKTQNFIYSHFLPILLFPPPIKERDVMNIFEIIQQNKQAHIVVGLVKNSTSDLFDIETLYDSENNEISFDFNNYILVEPPFISDGVLYVLCSCIKQAA